MKGKSIWTVHGDGRAVRAGAVVAPDERLSWPRTIGVGAQHVLAMFGGTIVLPLLIGFPPTTMLFFSGIGTLLFLLVVRNTIPSYLGSSYSFIAPVIAAKQAGGIPAALGGIIVVGLLLVLIGFVVSRAGVRVIEWAMPPIVTGAIVALIGVSLAPVAEAPFFKDPWLGLITIVITLIVAVGVGGFVGRLAVLLGIVAGYLVALVGGQVDFAPVTHAAWVGAPHFNSPSFNVHAILLLIPLAIVLIAENTGHVKAVAAMTERDLDQSMARAYVGDGLATMISGAGGGSGTTTYAENIGVMAVTRIYSTAAYVVAAVVAIVLAFSPKVGALISSVPSGVLGGTTTVLFGLVAMMGVRIWLDGRVDFRDPVNLMTAAVAVIVGAGNYTLTSGDFSFGGVTLGSVAAIVMYHVLRGLQRRSGASVEGVDNATPTTGETVVPALSVERRV